MKRFIETIKNIWNIEELKGRILLTLGLLLVYRFGAAVVLPGIDPAQLSDFQTQAESGLLGLLSIFTGGAFSKASVLALGIMPYISASIVVQLLGFAVPYMQKLQKDGESGRNKLNQITRYLTIVICVLQAPGFLALLPDAAFIDFGTNFLNQFYAALRILILITGCMFAMWLGERITDKGIGNGISLLIMVGIIASLPFSLAAEFAEKMGVGNGGLFVFVFEIIVFLLITMFTIFVIQGVRRVPIQVAKRVGERAGAGARSYLPLRVNASGVMPIIFAQAIMFVPPLVAGQFTEDQANPIISALTDYQGFWYNFIFAILIIVFTFFYTALTVNTNRMAEDLKRGGSFVPGIKPGKDTAEYLDSILSRIVFPGALILGIIAIIPAFVTKAGVNPTFAQFFGGTSLLIIVGVILDTLQQIESYLLARHYDGLMKTGRVKGRSGSTAPTI